MLWVYNDHVLIGEACGVAKSMNFGAYTTLLVVQQRLFKGSLMYDCVGCPCAHRQLEPDLRAQ